MAGFWLNAVRSPFGTVYHIQFFPCILSFAFNGWLARSGRCDMLLGVSRWTCNILFLHSHFIYMEFVRCWPFIPINRAFFPLHIFFFIVSSSFSSFLLVFYFYFSSCILFRLGSTRIFSLSLSSFILIWRWRGSSRFGPTEKKNRAPSDVSLDTPAQPHQSAWICDVISLEICMKISSNSHAMNVSRFYGGMGTYVGLKNYGLSFCLSFVFFFFCSHE